MNWIRNIIALSVMPLGVFVALAVSAYASPLKPQSDCAIQLKSCFALKGIQKSNCFYTTARLPTCQGSKIGKLALERWSLAVDSTGGGEIPPGLLGPADEIIDSACVENCDTKWLSLILAGNFQSDQVESCYDSCRVSDNLNLLQP